MKEALAPIVLFVYNRPWHTEQTLRALEKNKLASDSILYVFADGPKEKASSEEIEKIEKVREVVRKKMWAKEVNLIRRETNIGLAENVITGVTEVLDKYSKSIVLEDDIVTGKYFLQFMNEALLMYQDEKQVFGISGYRFPSKHKRTPNTFFLPIMSSWGYATWADRWKKINFNGDELLSIVEDQNIKSRLNFGAINYYQMLKDQVGGKNQSWAVRFYTSMFLKKGVFLYPKVSLLKNIGFDGTGVHCNTDSNDLITDFNENNKITVKRKKVSLETHILKNFNKRAMTSDKKFFSSLKRKTLKLISKIKKRILRKDINDYRNKNGDSMQTLRKLPRYTRTTFKLSGYEIIIPDSASFLFMHKEIFQDEIYKFKTSKRNPYIIDGGANIGLSIIYQKQRFPEAEIVAFEPDPAIFQILETNLNTFGFSNISLLQKGLWSKDASLTFKAEGADAGILGDITENFNGNITVPVVSLKPFLNKKVDFLKLDIEGAETEVLHDIQEKLYLVDRIFIEYHSFIDKKQTLNEVINILTHAEFRLYISSPGVKSTSPFYKIDSYLNMDMQLNIYGVRPNK